MDEQASTALEGPLNHHVPFRSRVVVFDFDKKSLEVANEKKINKDHYQQFKLPRHPNEVTLFVDSTTESMLRDKDTTDGRSNVLLAKLHLNRLGTMNNMLRLSGRLSTLYVTKIE